MQLQSGRVLLLLALSFSIGSSASAQSNPFVGTWQANLEKSARHENHQFKSASMTFELDGDVLILKYLGINMAGKEEGSTRRLRPDNKEYPVEMAPGYVEVTRYIGTNLLESTAKKDGQVAGLGTYEVSADGKVLTATVKGVDAKGREFQQVIIFDRK
jgi:hypothetical protein